MLTEPWFSVEQVAKHLSVLKGLVYRWTEQGLRARKVGRLWQFKLARSMPGFAPAVSVTGVWPISRQGDVCRLPA